jgi:hypothetical protein
MSEILAPHTDVQLAIAHEAMEAVDNLADAIREGQISLQENFVKIGQALLSVEANQHWMQGKFKSFSQYVRAVADRAERKRTQLYHYLGVATDLLPIVTEKDLVAMGITNAAVLRTMLTAGHQPTTDLIELAKDGTTSELKKQIGISTGLFLPQEVDEDWFDLGQMKVSAEQRSVFMRAVNCMIKHCGGDNLSQIVIDTDKDWVDLAPTSKAEIIEFMCAEFLATWGAVL